MTDIIDYDRAIAPSDDHKHTKAIQWFYRKCQGKYQKLSSFSDVWNDIASKISQTSFDTFSSEGTHLSTIIGRQRRFVIDVFGPVFGLISVIITISYLLTNPAYNHFSTLLNTSAALYLFALPVLVRTIRAYERLIATLLAIVGLCLFASSWLNEGVQLVSILIVIQFPLVAIVLAGRRLGVRTLLVTIALIISICLYAAIRFADNTIEAHAYLYMAIFSVASTLLVWVMIVSLWVVIENSVEDLKHTNSQLAYSNSAKSAFLAQISHELRTPLNGIIGLSSLLTGDSLSESQDAKRGEYAQLINKSGLHLLDIVNEILETTELMSSQIHLSKAPVNLNEVLKFVVATVSPVANKNQQSLTFTGDETASLVNGDEVKLRQVLINLVGNACKYGNVKSTIEVDLRTVGSTNIQVRIVNEGPNLSEEDIALAFEPFGRINKDSDVLDSEIVEGAGLGLPISRRLVEAHDGILELANFDETHIVASITLPTLVSPDAF